MRTLMLTSIAAGLSWLLFGPPSAASAVGVAWPGRTVVVYDHSGWSEVAPMVEAFNAVRPKRAPRLIHRDLSGQPCRKHRRGITVCEAAILDDAAGTFSLVYEDGWAERGTIRLLVDALHGERQRIVCHELMHVLTGIGDRYAVDPETGVVTGPYPDQSCVWGILPHPGPFDVAYAKRVYGKQRRH
jgi:hypothetical protein